MIVDGVSPDLRSWLSPAELGRYGRLRFDRDRRRFLASHGFLRALLARQIDCRPRTVQLSRAPTGKHAELERGGCAPSSALLTGWTRKEAVLNACGDGLRREPASVEVGISASAAPRIVTCPTRRRGASCLRMLARATSPPWPPKARTCG